MKSQFNPELVEIDQQTTAVIRGEVATKELAGFFDRSFKRLNEVISGQGVDIVSPAFGLYHRQPGETADLEVGFATGSAVHPDGEVEAGTLPGGRVARVVHAGSFDDLGASWERLASWIEDQDLAPGQSFWEVYLTEPSPDMDPTELRTELNWPVV